MACPLRAAGRPWPSDGKPRRWASEATAAAKETGNTAGTGVFVPDGTSDTPSPVSPSPVGTRGGKAGTRTQDYSIINCLQSAKLCAQCCAQGGFNDPRRLRPGRRAESGTFVLILWEGRPAETQGHRPWPLARLISSKRRRKYVIISWGFIPLIFASTTLTLIK